MLYLIKLPVVPLSRIEYNIMNYHTNYTRAATITRNNTNNTNNRNNRDLLQIATASAVGATSMKVQQAVARLVTYSSLFAHGWNESFASQSPRTLHRQTHSESKYLFFFPKNQVVDTKSKTGNK